MRKPSHIHFSPGILSGKESYGNPFISQAAAELAFSSNFGPSLFNKINSINAELSVDQDYSITLSDQWTYTLGPLNFDSVAFETAYSSNIGPHSSCDYTKLNSISTELSVDHAQSTAAQDNWLLNMGFPEFDGSVAVETAYGSNRGDPLPPASKLNSVSTEIAVDYTPTEVTQDNHIFLLGDTQINALVLEMAYGSSIGSQGIVKLGSISTELIADHDTTTIIQDNSPLMLFGFPDMSFTAIETSYASNIGPEQAVGISKLNSISVEISVDQSFSTPSQDYWQFRIPR